MEYGRRKTDGGRYNASYLSAEEAAAQDGTWFPQENGHGKWQESARQKKIEGQKEANCIKTAFVVFFLSR
jgi:hypothetical protein